MAKLKIYLLSSLWLLLASCATLNPNFQSPSVKLVSLTPITSQGMEQRFKIGLRVLNPNATSLNVRGLSYDLSLNGHELISGVTSEVPTIKGFSDQLINLEAGVSLLGGAQLLYDLMQNSPKDINYELVTRLSLGSWRLPIKVSESGTIDLGGRR